MKFLALFASIFFIHLALANSLKDIITDPAVSLRCKELIKERNQKVIIKQKMKNLLKRSQNAISRTPLNKKSVLSRLKITGQELKNEIYLINIDIANKEENIVRKGCPGIRL